MKKLTLFITILLAFAMPVSSISAMSNGHKEELSANASTKQIENHVNETVKSIKETKTSSGKVITFTEPNGNTTKVKFNKNTDEVTFESESLNENEIKNLEKTTKQNRQENKNNKNHKIGQQKQVTPFADGIPSHYTHFMTYQSTIDPGDNWVTAAVLGAIIGSIGGAGPVSGAIGSVVSFVIANQLPLIYTANHVYVHPSTMTDSYEHVHFFWDGSRLAKYKIIKSGVVFYHRQVIVA